MGFQSVILHYQCRSFTLCCICASPTIIKLLHQLLCHRRPLMLHASPFLFHYSSTGRTFSIEHYSQWSSARSSLHKSHIIQVASIASQSVVRQLHIGFRSVIPHCQCSGYPLCRTRASPAIIKLLHHLICHRHPLLLLTSPFLFHSSSVGSTFSTNPTPQPVDICSHLTTPAARHPSNFVTPQPTS